MKHLDIKEFYLSNGLYAEIDISNYSGEELLNALFYFRSEQNLNKAPTIKCYCKDCGENVNFHSLESPAHLKSNINYLHNHLYEANEIDNRNIILESLDDTVPIISRIFKCPNVPDHTHNIIFLLKVKNNKIFKIGQFPAFNDLNISELKRIRKFKSNVYTELNKSTGLFSHGIGVGSYVYLRRVLEKHIVNPKFIEKIKSEDNPNDYNNYYFHEKVKYLGNDISEFLGENTKLYGFISKGIHELEEDECIEFFPLVYKTVVMILEEEIDIEERKKKKLEIQKQLNKLK